MTKQINKIIKYGLYLLIFMLPFQTRLIIRQGAMSGWPYEFGTLSLYATDILLLVLIILNAWMRLTTESPGRNRGDYAAAKEIPAESLGATEETLQQPGNTKACNLGSTALPSVGRDYGTAICVPLVWWLIGGIELASFISIFMAIDKAVAVQFYLRLLLGIGLFWVVTSAYYNRQKLIDVFVASAIVQAVLGIWQFLAQATFANKFLGMAKHLPVDIGASVITAADGERWLRAYGSLDHPNILGGLMAVTLLVVLRRLFSPQEPTPTLPFVKGGGAAFYCLVIAILICGLFFSFSRAAWIGFGAGLIILILFNFFETRTSLRTRVSAYSCSDGVPNLTPHLHQGFGGQAALSLRRRGGLSAMLVIIVTIFVLSIVFHNLIFARALNNTVTENKSINDRLSSYKIDIEMLKENWLLGVGAGNYGLAVQNKFDGLDYNAYQPVHNVFLLIYSEIGILGFVCFCSLIIYLGWLLIKIGGNSGLGIVIGICAMFLFDHWWWSLHFGILFFWLLSGVLYKKYKKEL